MTPYQACLRIAELIEASGTFSAVAVTDGKPTRLAGYLDLPLAVARSVTWVHDPQDNGIIDATLEVFVALELAETEAAQTGVDASAQMAPYLDEILAAVGRLRAQDGVTIRVAAAGLPEPKRIQGYIYREGRYKPEGRRLILWAKVRLRAILTAAPTYPAASGVAAADLTGGAARVTWTDPPGETLDQVMIRRASGSTPPATSSSGTLVAQVAPGVGTYDDTPTAGTWSYTVFGQFDTDGDGDVDETSGSGPGASATVTVT